MYKLIDAYKILQEQPVSKKKPEKKVKEDSSEPEFVSELKSKKKRKNKAPSKIFDEHRPWVSSTESSEEEKEEVEEEEEAIEEEPPLEFKSDHEFSPESDIDAEYQPPKRARTAKKKIREGKFCFKNKYTGCPNEKFRLAYFWNFSSMKKKKVKT